MEQTYTVVDLGEKPEKIVPQIASTYPKNEIETTGGMSPTQRSKLLDIGLTASEVDRIASDYRAACDTGSTLLVVQRMTKSRWSMFFDLIVVTCISFFVCLYMMYTILFALQEKLLELDEDGRMTKLMNHFAVVGGFVGKY